MIATYSGIDEKIRDRILHRARCAVSLDCMSNVIYDALVEADVDWRGVELEDVKSVLVDAVRAFRNSRAA